MPIAAFDVIINHRMSNFSQLFIKYIWRIDWQLKQVFLLVQKGIYSQFRPRMKIWGEEFRKMIRLSRINFRQGI